MEFSTYTCSTRAGEKIRYGKITLQVACGHPSLHCALTSSFLCSVKKIHKQTLVQGTQHWGGMNVLLIAPFFLSRIRRAWSTWPGSHGLHERKLLLLFGQSQLQWDAFYKRPKPQHRAPVFGGTLNARTDGQEVVHHFCFQHCKRKPDG